MWAEHPQSQGSLEAVCAPQTWCSALHKANLILCWVIFSAPAAVQRGFYSNVAYFQYFRGIIRQLLAKYIANSVNILCFEVFPSIVVPQWFLGGDTARASL